MVEILICSSFFTFSLKDSGSTADCRVLSWQAEVAGSCLDTAEAPPLNHSQCRFFLWSFERLPAGMESKKVPNGLVPEKNEAADA